MKITKTVLNESEKKAVVHFYIEGEQGDSEQLNDELFNPTTDLTMSVSPAMRMTMTQIWNSASWFDILLSFDDLQEQPSWLLPRDTTNYYDFRYFGGLKNRAGVDGNPGKLLMSTNGFGAGSIATFVIEFKKD